MSNQVGDCFKFLWPFHNVRTLTRMFNTKLKIQLSDWYDIQNLIDSYELIRREKLNLKVKVCVASMLLKHFFSNKEENQLAKWSILLYVYYIFSYRKKSKYLQKKSLIFLEWSLWFSRMWEKKPNCNTYIHKYIFMSNCSIKLEGNQSTSSSRMIAAVKTYHNTSKSVTCLLLESVSGLIYPYQFKQLKSNYHNMGQKSLWFWIFTHRNSQSRGGFSFDHFSFLWY